MVIMLIPKVYSWHVLSNHTKNFLILFKIIGYIKQNNTLNPYITEKRFLSYYFQNHNSVIWGGYLICCLNIWLLLSQSISWLYLQWYAVKIILENETYITLKPYNWNRTDISMYHITLYMLMNDKTFHKFT